MKKRRTKDKRTPGEKDYYDWLKDQPALDGGECEHRHHLRKQRYGAGTSKKSMDYFAVPLSAEKHAWAHDNIDEGFAELNPWVPILWERYGLDRIPAEVQALLIT